MPKRRPHVLREGAARALFGTAAALSIAAVALICLFLLANGVPAMAEIGLPEFLFGTTWRPANDLYGIFPMIVGSLYVTAGAMIVGVPGGLLTALYLSRFARGRTGSFLRSGVELLAGIPSVVYGFFGLVIIVPFVRLLGPGTGAFGAGSQPYLRHYDPAYRHHRGPKRFGRRARSLLRGCPGSRRRSRARRVQGGGPGGRLRHHGRHRAGAGTAIGETMAVVMVAGNMPIIPDSLLSGVRTMTANIVLEMGYAADLHREALIATGVVLFVFILLITMLLNVIRKRGEAR